MDSIKSPVTVVVPCFNARENITACLQSIAPEVPVIVVDDGSQDASTGIAYVVRPDARFIEFPSNRGPAAARNAGLKWVKTKYVCFLDADDMLHPDFLRKTAETLEQDNLEYCQTEIEIMNAHRPISAEQKLQIEDSLPGNILIRTDFARAIGGFPEDPAFRGPSGGEDCVFRAKLRKFCPDRAHWVYKKIAEPLYRYRARQGSHLDRFLDGLAVTNEAMTAARKTYFEGTT